MTLTEVRTALAALELRPSKSLGQNFLIDGNIQRLIVDRAEIRPDETVLEIGPGLGALTGALRARAARVIAIEKDRRLAEYLGRTLPDLELLAGDAVDLLRAALGGAGPAGRLSPAVSLPAAYTVVANLPYSVSTPILEALVEGDPAPRRLVLTLQREVAQRLAAAPRQHAYGALTVFTRRRYHVEIAHTISRRCFYPAPNVDSAVVLLLRRDPRVLPQDDRFFRDTVRRGFGQRRKMLRNHLGEPAAVDAALTALGLPQTVRGEELSVEQWIELANHLTGLRGEVPSVPR